MDARRFLRPMSFLGLVLLGFSLVSLPLFLALLQARAHVDRLERQGTGALYRAVSATQGSRALLEHLLSLERKARQFSVLGDAASLDAYREEDGKARETLRGLLASPLAGARRGDLEAISNGLQRVSAAMESSSGKVKEAAAAFDELNRLARELLSESDRLVLAEASALEELTGRAKTSLAWQALAAVPAALAFAVLFVLLISRPVRQIDRALRRLGTGDFSAEISVGGPGDLQALGQRLDWLRRRLLELQGEKARFLARASHDLKTPLAAVREGADLLLEQLLGPLGPRQSEVATILRDNSLKLQRSIQALLDYSVGEARAGGEAEEPRPVSLQTLIRSVLADNGPSAEKKGLKLAADGPEVWVLGDAESLRVALDNLVSNSVKFTPPGGAIAVSVASSGGSARIDVRDTGPGIAEADRERIFEDFYQGKVAGDGPIRGSGLGLSIAREHVVRHGGRIEVVTSSSGAHFRVTLALGGKGKER